jgi:hypothetical protein
VAGSAATMTAEAGILFPATRTPVALPSSTTTDVTRALRVTAEEGRRLEAEQA